MYTFPLMQYFFNLPGNSFMNSFWMADSSSCCIMNYPQMCWLKATNIYYLRFVAQEFRSPSAGWFWLRVFHKASKDTRRGCCPRKAWVELEVLLLSSLAGLLTDPEFTLTAAPPQGCLTIFRTWQVAFTRMSKQGVSELEKEQEKSHYGFYGIASEVTLISSAIVNLLRVTKHSPQSREEN